MRRYLKVVTLSLVFLISSSHKVYANTSSFTSAAVGSVLVGAGLIAGIVAAFSSGDDSDDNSEPVEHSVSVVGWGNNEYSQLGVDSGRQYSLPMDTQGIESGAEKITGGKYHTCAVVNGGAKCWGYNSYGQLGDGSTDNSDEPVNVKNLGESSGVIAIEGGDYHTCVLMDSGAVKCWGYNSHGQLGNGSTDSSDELVDVQGLGEGSGVVAIVAGGNHTCALMDSGAVKCWGYNYSGQLGNGFSGFSASSSIPVDVVVNPDPQQMTQLLGVKGVVAGDNHTCALLNSGMAKCWGNNSAGQLGNGNVGGIERIPVDVVADSQGALLLSNVGGIASGGYHNCVFLEDGTAKCWGGNSSGQLGNGSTDSSGVPVDVEELSGVVAVVAGNGHICSLMDVGTIKCWGGNSNGQLGNGSNSNSGVPVDVGGLEEGLSVAALTSGGSHTCIVAGGKVKCWGYNRYGQLGVDTKFKSLVPIDVTSAFGQFSKFEMVAAGSNYSCAVIDGGVECWGDNSNGQLGDGSNTYRNTPVSVEDLGTGSNVTAVAVGNSHVCALTNGNVKCWGANWNGQLGDDSNTSSNTPVDVKGLENFWAEKIVAGDEHTCVIGENESGYHGAVKCWGGNWSGQLGDGSTEGSRVPVNVLASSGGGELVNVEEIAAGGYHTCAIVNGGAICWGENLSGQLGDGSNVSSKYPVRVVADDNDTEVTSISAGGDNSCAIVDEGVKCWGSNGEGQLGDGSNVNSNIPVSVEGLGDGSGVKSISVSRTDVAMGGFVCALVENKVKCWGSNMDGQLGNGSSVYNSNIPVDVSGVNGEGLLDNVADISFGGVAGHIMAIIKK